MPIKQKTSQLADVTALTVLYVAPASTNSVAASVVICNRTAGELTFDVAVIPGGGAVTDKNYFYFEHKIPAKDTFVATIGIGLTATDEISVKGSAVGLSFSFTGPEFT